MKVEDARLFVFFPTGMETHVGLILQGPYRTTPARDNVPPADDFNQHLVKETAALLKNSLNVLKKLGLLSLDALATLPINHEKFKEGSFFHPLYAEVRDVLTNQPLLPTACGGFISGAQAKLAGSKDLVKLFSEQLGMLFGKDGLKWLDASITEKAATAELHTYLVGRKKQHQQVWEVAPLFEGMQVDADTLAPKLTADFLGMQPMAWLIQFIQYAMGGAQSLREVPFIRLKSCEHISLASCRKAQPSAWFSPNDTAGLDLSVFPLVHAELAANEPIRKFLEKEGLHEIDAAAIVGQCILPQYENGGTPFDESNYRDHLRQIRKAFTEANDASKNQLIENLKGVAWLACVHASGNTPDEIVWEKPEAPDLFAKTSIHETWFHGLAVFRAYFLHPAVQEEFNGEDIVASLAKPCKCLWKNGMFGSLEQSTPSDTTTISWIQKNYEEAQNGFNPKADIYGLKAVLDNLSVERTQALWRILIEKPYLLRGVVLRAKTTRALKDAPQSPEFSIAGKLLSDSSWLPNKASNWHKPNELFLTDLPGGFETTSVRAKEVAERLGMKQPEREQALEIVTGGDPNLKRLIDLYQSGSNSDREKLNKMIPTEVPPQPAPTFKDGLKGRSRSQRGEASQESASPSPVSNPDRYQKKLDGGVEDAVKTHLASPHTVTFSPVRNQASNSDARNFLYSEYQGCCQVTGHTFPKASANAEGVTENYFEAYALLSYPNADYLNDAGNMLCVSADTMAKLKNASFEWVDVLEEVIGRFNNREPGNKAMARILLAGEKAQITWSERHFMRLIALWNKA